VPLGTDHSFADRLEPTVGRTRITVTLTQPVAQSRNPKVPQRISEELKAGSLQQSLNDGPNNFVKDFKSLWNNYCIAMRG
jgi:hypothetical protein